MKLLPPEIESRIVYETVKPDDENPTRSLQILKIIHEPKPCEACGLIVTDRQTHKRLYQQPLPHWRESCRTCLKLKNPDTGCFDLTQKDSYNFYFQRFKTEEQTIKRQIRQRETYIKRKSKGIDK
jgi:hypothetical protein